MKYQFIKFGACGTMLSLMAGCFGGSSAAQISLENPGFFGGRITEQSMQGVYNPEGFSAKQVKKLVSRTCVGDRLTGFNTQNQPDGLMAFTASCNDWRGGARFVEYERRGGANVLIEITGSHLGNITYGQIETTL